jgi:ATP-binding cassette, subfamily F, member 3
VLAGLLLKQHNVLVLDEPGNHLDVETVEALARALKSYAGTVVFTSHDRYFMREVATDVIEVRDGRVVIYPGSYDDYVYRTEKEIDDGLRSEAAKHPPLDNASVDRKAQARNDRDTQKRQKAVERKIAKLDEERKALQVEQNTITDARRAKQVHDQLAALSAEIESLEHEWLELFEASQ